MRWRKLEDCSALFLTSVTLHEDTLLWRIQCIFLRHGFLSIKEMILLPWLFCEFWNRKSDILLYSFLQNMQTVSYMQLKDFIVRKKNMVLESCEKHASSWNWKGFKHVWRSDLSDTTYVWYNCCLHLNSSCYNYVFDHNHQGKSQ